jgi:glucosamine--fructose-6-phosphate aminotransferase (isomerizing)
MEVRGPRLGGSAPVRVEPRTRARRRSGDGAARAAHGRSAVPERFGPRVGGCVGFVYKAAAEIGELGDNTAALRAAIGADPLLQLLLRQPDSRISVLGHTRWASVGIISEANCHPVNSDEAEMSAGEARPYVVAALNGDVDNHADVKVALGLRIPGPITTDAKVIPAGVARTTTATGGDLVEAFRRSVAGFDGSVAIAAAAANRPDRVMLALRGSGQGLYVGFAEDLFIVASEPYGMVEETARFVRVDGETPARAGEPQSRGQVVVLDGSRAGELGGVQRLRYDGTPLPVRESDVALAQVTTRDIDRGDAPHFLLKEISEAPRACARPCAARSSSARASCTRVVGERAFPRRSRRGSRGSSCARSG